MSDTPHETLPPAQEIAVAYAAKGRHLLHGFFALDMHCAGLVRRTSEPLLAQMRLTWWREMLSLPPAERAKGEPLLKQLAAWGDEADSLAVAVSAWEHLVGEEPLDRGAALAFATGRAEGLAGFARLLGRGQEVEAVRAAGARWSLADLASHLTAAADKEEALAAARVLPQPSRLSRPLRPLTILDGLARRSLARGGAPLLGDRGSVLLALRLGLLGR